ncbi:MAG TPA: DNA-processing protein DprA [Herpetosiphonaceae bacterium]
MDERTARLAFNLTPGIGPARLRALIEHCGSAGAAWAAGPADWRAAGLDRRAIETLGAAKAGLDLAAAEASIAAAGLRMLLTEDEAYPELLRQIHDPPPLIYVRGTLLPADRWAVAVVGTRAPTHYGREAARRLAGELAAAGVTIVSGLALGVDAIAHRAALECHGRTFAVLGCGLATVYPAQHRELADRIAGQGALISEYPPGAAPLAGNFPARNRVISGLALGTLVVEAGARSGALITAQFALEQNREVFAVPGSIFSPASDGPNQLLVEGATLARTVDSILEQLQLGAAAVQQEMQLLVPETPEEAALLAGLSGAPRHIDELGRACGLPAAVVAATLSMMELKGMARHIGGMLYVAGR